MSDQASTIMVNTLEPQSGTTLTVGKSGQNLQVNADSLKANVAKDAGGNAIFTSNGSGTLSGVNSGFGSAQVLLSSQTADGSASLSFTSDIDSTYNHYIFQFVDINPATADMGFEFQCSIDGGSNYNIQMTSTIFQSGHNEANTWYSLNYLTASDQASGTNFQPISFSQGNFADATGVGELHLYNPSSTVYVKNYWSTYQMMANAPSSVYFRGGGFFDTTTAINAIQFKMNSGNFDGTIKMFGIK